MLQINMWIDHRTSRLCVAHALVVPGYPLGPPLLGTPASVILGYNGPKEAPMYFEQFYLGCLSHASYMAGSEAVAEVIDPTRRVAVYLEAGRQSRLRIEHVIETRLQADFVSGHRELAARTGAKIY